MNAITPKTSTALAVYLDCAIFPCSRIEIFCCADANGAPDHVLNAIEGLPEKRYMHPEQVLPS